MFCYFTTLRADSAGDTLMIFFLFFHENRIKHFVQIVSNGDSLHELSKLVFWGKIEKNNNISSAEKFTYSAKCW